jgi:hypothetical protein
MTEKLLEDMPPSDVSPYLERPLRTLSQAKQDQNAALLELVTEDSRLKPKP